jgi:calcium-dependent protein kinase
LFAQKKVKTSRTKKRSRQVVFVREVGLLQQINHPNTVRFYDFFEDPDFYYIVMEFYTGGELFQKILEVLLYGILRRITM